MAKPGPKRTPNALKIARGNPGHYPINDREPKIVGEIGDCPDWLVPEAKKKWEKTIKSLEDSGVLTGVDGYALAIYCDTWAHWKAATRRLHQDGYTIEGVKGGDVKHPVAQVVKDCAALCLRFQNEFGMTPSSRSSIRIPEKPKVDDKAGKARFFK